MDVLVRTYGRSTDDVAEFLDLLVASNLVIATVDDEVGRLAGRLRATHYARRTRELSLGDCVALATAILVDDALATADPSLARVASEEGRPVIPLPDTAGRTPSVS